MYLSKNIHHKENIYISNDVPSILVSWWHIDHTIFILSLFLCSCFCKDNLSERPSLLLKKFNLLRLVAFATFFSRVASILEIPTSVEWFKSSSRLVLLSANDNNYLLTWTKNYPIGLRYWCYAWIYRGFQTFDL